MNSSTSSQTSIYKKIAQQLRARIVQGMYLVGQHLPAEKQLAEDFKTSRHTIREALRELRQDGIIASRQGSGSIVCATANYQSFVHETNTINEIDQYASSTIKILENRLVDLDSSISRHFMIAEKSGWMLLEGYRYLANANEPICVMQAFLHPRYISVGRIFGKRQIPLYELIEDNFGVVIDEVEQIISTCLLSEKQAKVLSLPTNSTAIEIQRFYKLKDGEIVEISRNVYSPQSFAFPLKLKRSSINQDALT